MICEYAGLYIGYTGFKGNLPNHKKSRGKQHEMDTEVMQGLRVK